MKEQITRAISMAALKIRKHSPEIFLAVGIAGGIAATVMACKATPKAARLIEEKKTELNTIEAANCDFFKHDGRYSDEDYRNDKIITCTQTVIGLIKIYAPAAVIGAVSITSILVSHNILKSRNLALSAAYAAVSGSFKEYRKRVADQFGSETEDRIRKGFEALEMTKTVTDENGNEVTVTEKVNKRTEGFSEYSCFFDDNNGNYEGNEYDMYFLQAQQNLANDKLRANGFLFLNDVYDMIGQPRTKAGQIVGWVWNNENGDGFVDFGLRNAECYSCDENDNDEGPAYVYHKAYRLDFNVDGNILDLI